MKLAVSNLGWERKNEIDAFNTLKSNGIRNVEFVFTKMADWKDINHETLHAQRLYFAEHEMIPESVQAIFYNTGITKFGDEALAHFEKLIGYCDILGIRTIVLGAPNMRKKYSGWEKDLIDMFWRLNELLRRTTITVVIEPNSKYYGAEYFNSVDEIAKFIKKNTLTNIKTMVDTYNSGLEKRNPSDELLFWFDYIHHIHISDGGSEMDFTVKNCYELYERFGETIRSTGYDNIVTLELLNGTNFKDNVKTFCEIYG